MKKQNIEKNGSLRKWKEHFEDMKQYKLLVTILLLFVLSFTLVSCSSSLNWIDVPVNMDELNALQQEVDNGHRVGLLDPEQIINEFLESNLQIPASLITSKEQIRSSQGEVEFLVTLNDGRKFHFVLFQPVRQDQTGIWAVKKYAEEK